MCGFGFWDWFKNLGLGVVEWWCMGVKVLFCFSKCWGVYLVNGGLGGFLIWGLWWYCVGYGVFGWILDMFLV